MAGEDYWTRERNFGGVQPASLDRMKENAHATIVLAHSSQTEISMARCILYLLNEIRTLLEASR